MFCKWKSRLVSIIFPNTTTMFIACNWGIKVVSWLLSQFIAKSMAKNYSDGYWFSLETENWKCIIKKSRVLSSCLFPIRAKSKFVCVSGKPRQVKTAELQMSRWWWLFLRHEIIPSVNTKHSNANIFINNSQAGTQPGTLGLIEQLNNNDVQIFPNYLPRFCFHRKSK